jgi:uncharacterized membrane protein
MIYAALKAIHLLSIVLWVGGMAFVMLFLRPALPLLPPPDRLKLMREVLRRFFAGVTAAVLLALATGAWMVERAARSTVQGGGRFAWPADWVAMAAIGLAMAVIFGVIRLVFYPRFVRALQSGDLPAAAAGLARIRAWVAVNLVLGVAVIVVAVML